MVLEKYKQLSSGSQKGTSGHANANLTMQAPNATLNCIALKSEVDGQPILESNPVKVLRQEKVWHRVPDRQGVIPDHKLRAWVSSVLSVGNPIARDYFLVLLFTGLRRNEAACLEGRDIDLQTKTITIRAEINKVNGNTGCLGVISSSSY